jgi:hypothetical protein
MTAVARDSIRCQPIESKTSQILRQTRKHTLPCLHCTWQRRSKGRFARSQRCRRAKREETESTFLGPAIARRRHLPLPGPTHEDITNHLKREDDRWKRITAWAVQEALEWRGIMAVFGVLVRTAEGGGSCVHELGLLWFRSESWASYRGYNCATSYGKRSKQKSPYGPSYNMAVRLLGGHAGHGLKAFQASFKCTKYTISNHPLFQRSVLDIKLRE